MKLKIITGFSDDEKFTIEAEEAHKAYHLFLNPEKRGVFNNGVAIVGSNIKAIKPDYNATMGWNASYKLTDDDWSDIRSKGVDVKLQEIISTASNVAKLADGKPELLQLPLSEASTFLLDDPQKKQANILAERLTR